MGSPPPKDMRRGDLGFERTLWAAAEQLRSDVDAAEYKHIVLGLVFLKYASALPDDEHVFRVPEEARWAALEARAAGRAPMDGHVIDEVMAAIERDNPALRGALPRGYARVALPEGKLRELVRLFSSVGLSGEATRTRDVLGRIYEYFLAQFARAEGQRGGQFYTPQPLVRLLVRMLAPVAGVVYDPCCGSGGMFVQSELFSRERGDATGGSAAGLSSGLSFYGQESNATTLRLARMNMAIHGIAAELGQRNADTLRCDLHEGLRADYILANPPFNAAAWGAEHLRGDGRFSLGAPPAGNANFAWVQHIVAHLSPTGTAGFILANGAMSSSQAGEAEIRRALVEADLVECVVALPDKLFYATQIPASLWVLTRDKRGGARRRARAGEALFIDARALGQMVDRTHRVLTDEDITRVACAYHAFRGDRARPYKDEPGFCRAADQAEIARHRFALVPGRFVGFARRAGEEHELSLLRQDVLELEARIEEVAAASQGALAVLKAALHG